MDLPAAWGTLPGGDWLPGARRRYLRASARRLVERIEGLPPWLEHAMRGVRPIVGELLRVRPQALYAALSLPTVGAPLHGGDLAAAVPNLLGELARQRLLDREGVWWPGSVSQLAVPALGTCPRFAPPRGGLLFGPGWIELGPSETWSLDEARGDRCFLPLEAGGWLATMDANPLAMVEAHPDKAGNTVSLGDRPIDAWVSAIDAARRLISATLPALAAEHAAVLATVVPVGTHPELSESASYREAIGQVYLSLHPDLVTLAEALVHEVQHSKANLLTWGGALLENPDEVAASPLRPDPRPLWGVLLAVHAFLPVGAMHRELCRAGHPLADRTRTAEVARLNHEGMDVLRARARPVGEGVALLAGMDALERALGG